MYKCHCFYFFLFLFFYIQPVDQLAFFGAMSTPPDIPAPNVSVMCVKCKTFQYDRNKKIIQVNYI